MQVGNILTSKILISGIYKSRFDRNDLKEIMGFKKTSHSHHSSFTTEDIQVLSLKKV